MKRNVFAWRISQFAGTQRHTTAKLREATITHASQASFSVGIPLTVNRVYCDVCFFRFPNENYGDRYVLIVSSMKLMYHKGWRTNVLSQILSVTHPPAVGLRSRCRPLTSVSFNYAPFLPPFMLPFRIIFDIYIIKLRMWRDGSRLAAVCLGRWKFVGPRRSSLHSVRFGQLLVTLCTSTHCQCNESVHRKELLLFTPFMTV